MSAPYFGAGRFCTARLPTVARVVLPVLLSASMACGYSILTHEAIVDSLWDTSIQKLLLKRFPDTTPEELNQAHAHVYGGCILQDLGYYPFSSRLFSDLTHYVRSGDFIVALIRESQDVNEFAFALGALAHYAADTSGHRIATNRAVPMLYPNLHRKFGDEVTYWDDPLSHARTEFAFDVLQIAQGRYAPDQYRSFIGFQVSKPVLERAFLDTYGIEIKDIFRNLDLALGTYRYSVGSIIPGMTRVAWQLKKDAVIKEVPGITRKKFLYNLSRASYEKEWGSEYHKPGIRTRLVTWLVRILPKSGPFKALPFRMPTPEVERMFMASFNATVDRYRALLANVDAGRLELPNENFDVGEPTIAGRYKGADEAYSKLVGKLADRQFAGVSAELRSNILVFHRNPKVILSTRSTVKERAEWAKLVDQLGRLEAIPASE
ncbi:MAG: zinc dependent phospholipase C family protein [Bryobacteraceae bacterium]